MAICIAWSMVVQTAHCEVAALITVKKPSDYAGVQRAENGRRAPNHRTGEFIRQGGVVNLDH